MYFNTIVGLEYANMNKTQSLAQGSSSLVDGGTHAGSILNCIENLGWQVWPAQKPESGHRWMRLREEGNRAQLTV